MRLEVEFSCGWVKYIGALLFHMISLELPCNLVLLEMKALCSFRKPRCLGFQGSGFQLTGCSSMIKQHGSCSLRAGASFVLPPCQFGGLGVARADYESTSIGERGGVWVRLPALAQICASESQRYLRSVCVPPGMTGPGLPRRCQRLRCASLSFRRSWYRRCGECQVSCHYSEWCATATRSSS